MFGGSRKTGCALAVSGAMRTHPGLVRPLNEDSIAFILPPGGEAGPSLVVLADGMGGHEAGEVASALAVGIVTDAFFADKARAGRLLRGAFARANEAILAHGAAHPETAGLGTTCTAFVAEGDVLHLAHIGDSRAYLHHAGSLAQVSEDHSYVGDLVRRGLLTEEEAAHHPERNVILQALGTSETVTPQFREVRIETGDTVVVCSDGLSDLVDAAVIAEACALPPDLACADLIDRALEAGGHDNVSVGVFRFEAGAPRSADIADTREIPVPAEGAG